jgi:PTH1 family peptidyl-tRNA hydrolase
MMLVVGLGNPGKKYDGTRHNVGFEIIRQVARQHGFPAAKSIKSAEVQKGSIGGQEVLLAQPMTYMNLSGDAVGGLARYYKIEVEDIVVVHDELDFEPGVVRIKNGGGHGGHNGLRSIIGHMGREFLRVRVGVGKPEAEGADHVLSRFSGNERILINEAIDRAVKAVEMLVREGEEAAMRTFNRKE